MYSYLNQPYIIRATTNPPPTPTLSPTTYIQPLNPSNPKLPPLRHSQIRTPLIIARILSQPSLATSPLPKQLKRNEEKTYLINLRPPPTKPLTSPTKINRKENHHPSNRHRRIQRRTQHKIILIPPPPHPPPNPPPKRQSHNSPTAITRPRRRRKVIQPAQKQRDMNSPPEGIRVAAFEEVDGDGEDSANDEEVE